MEIIKSKALYECRHTQNIISELVIPEAYKHSFIQCITKRIEDWGRSQYKDVL